MRKTSTILLSVILALAILICAASCGANTEPTSAVTTPEPTHSTQAPTSESEPTEATTETIDTESTTDTPSPQEANANMIVFFEVIYDFESKGLKSRTMIYRLTYGDGTSEDFKFTISQIKYKISEHKSNSAFFKITEGNVSVRIDPYVYDESGQPRLYSAMPNYTWIEVTDNGEIVRYEDGLLHKMVFSGPLALITDFEEVMASPGNYDGFLNVFLYDETGEEVGSFQLPITVIAE